MSVAVSAHPAPQVDEIRFEGARTFKRSTLIRLMRTQETSFLRRSHFDSEEFARDLDKLAAFYVSEGFLDIKVTAPSPEYALAGSSVTLDIKITEGPRWTVSDVGIAGAEAVPPDTLECCLRLQPGEVYRSRLVRSDRRAVLDEYAARGYLDARVIDRTVLDGETQTASLHYEIVEGPPAIVSRITIRGLEKTRPSVVLRELEFNAGNSFDLTRWGRSQSNLYNTGLFDWVWIQPAAADTGRAEKEVLVLVGEKPGGEISAGGGYGRFDRARLVASIRQGNLFGRAVRCGLEGKVSKVVRRVEFVVSEPWMFGRRFAANAGSAYEWRDEPEFLAESVEGTAVFTRALHTRVLAEGGYRLRRTNLLRVDPSAAGRDRQNVTSVLRAAISWKMRDDFFNTTRGFFLRIEGEYAGTFLGGTNQFLRLNVYWRHFAPLPIGGILALNTRLGAMSTFRHGDDIPINERYFMGGDRSVRGYARHSLGPTDSAGRPRGGRRLAELGQEFRVPLPHRLQAVIFVDEGILLNTRPRWKDWAVDAGGGFRVVTPVGNVRAEVALPVTTRWGTEAQYYLSIGQAF